MKTTVVRTREFREAWQHLAPNLQKIVSRKICQLAENPMYPSLQAHRVVHQAKAAKTWICYITATTRLLYQREGNTIYLLNVGSHTIVDHLHTRQFTHSLPLTAVS